MLSVMTLANPPNGSTRAPEIECRLQVPDHVKRGEPVTLVFELVSRDSRPLRILTWNTPFEGWFGRYLRVSLGDQEIPYRGPLVKRGPPEESEYLLLAPGGRIKAEVDLAEVYSLTAIGRYRVVFDGVLHDVTSRAPSREHRSPLKIDCGSATVEVTAR